MAARLGNVIYWFCAGFAAILVALPLLMIVFLLRPTNAGYADGLLMMGASMAAGVLLFLVGRAARYILAGR